MSQSPGTGLWLYGQPQQLDGKCPTTKKDAGENTDLCRVYVSEGPGGGKVLCDRNPSITGRRFLNANGFADQGLLVKPARLKAVEVNSPTGGGCWTLQGPNLEAGISPCNLADSSQKLYVRGPLPLYPHSPTLSSPPPFTNPDPPRHRPGRG